MFGWLLIGCQLLVVGCATTEDLFKAEQRAAEQLQAVQIDILRAERDQALVTNELSRASDSQRAAVNAKLEGIEQRLARLRGIENDLQQVQKDIRLFNEEQESYKARKKQARAILDELPKIRERYSAVREIPISY